MPQSNAFAPCLKGASAAQDGLGVRLLSPALFFVAGSWRIVLPHKSQKKFIWNLQMAAINAIPFNSWSDLFSGDQGTLDHAWKLFMEDLVPLVAIAPEGLRQYYPGWWSLVWSRIWTGKFVPANI